MMALASVDDQKRQLAVWKALPEYNRTAQGIKRKLTETEVPATDVRVRLIGVERSFVSPAADKPPDHNLALAPVEVERLWEEADRVGFLMLGSLRSPAQRSAV